MLRRARMAGIHMIVIAGIANAQSPDIWTRAESAIVRSRPSAFPELPVAIRRDLDRRGCTIPQLFDHTKLGNVISGAFLGPHRTDWAVLCSIARRSRVLVYSADADEPADSLSEAADKSFLQQYAEGVGYSRAITAMAPQHVRRLMPARGTGDASRHVDHDAIEIAFVDKASSVFYWNGTKWVELAGSD